MRIELDKWGGRIRTSSTREQYYACPSTTAIVLRRPRPLFARQTDNVASAHRPIHFSPRRHIQEPYELRPDLSLRQPTISSQHLPSALPLPFTDLPWRPFCSPSPTSDSFQSIIKTRSPPYTMSFVKLSIFGTSFEVCRWRLDVSAWGLACLLRVISCSGYHSLCRSSTGWNGWARHRRCLLWRLADWSGPYLVSGAFGLVW